MAEEKKVVDKEYLLRQLRLLAGKELYENVTTEEVLTPAEGTFQTQLIAKTTYTYYKYTGNKNGIIVATADEATEYTTLCGETISVGDKVRPSIVITDENLARYITTIANLEIDEMIKSTSADDWMVSDDPSSPVFFGYLNAKIFKEDKVQIGDVINYTDETTQNVIQIDKRIIDDIREKKTDLVEVTLAQYHKIKIANAIEKNVFYLISDLDETTCYFNGKNIFDGGSIDTEEAEDGQFMVYSAIQEKPVWVTVSNLDEILF